MTHPVDCRRKPAIPFLSALAEEARLFSRPPQTCSYRQTVEERLDRALSLLLSKTNPHYRWNAIARAYPEEAAAFFALPFDEQLEAVTRHFVASLRVEVEPKFVDPKQELLYDHSIFIDDDN